MAGPNSNSIRGRATGNGSELSLACDMTSRVARRLSCRSGKAASCPDPLSTDPSRSTSRRKAIYSFAVHGRPATSSSIW